MRILSAVREIANEYDGYILDLWGVLYDGIQVFPYAAACAEALLAEGKQLCILSNAPRRAQQLHLDLSRRGLACVERIGLLTSGELAWQELARADAPHASVLLIGPERSLGLAQGLRAARSLDDCEVILNAWASDSLPPPESYDEQFAACIARGVTMHCANPDHSATIGEVPIRTAGVLADRYRALGGKVRDHGKPTPEAFAACLALMHSAPRALMIGDGLATDIAGARLAGLDCALITASGLKPPADLHTLPASQAPTYLLPRLEW